MKNVHLIPTDKPSRLLKTIQKGNLILSKSITSGSHWENQNIYITSDEEIKVGDWVYSKSRNKICKVTEISKWTHKNDYSIDLDNENYFIHHSYCKKIILTTDQDLIKDGVQAIDDDFLEWFVKNPKCEVVQYYTIDNSTTLNTLIKYKIIIPKEEPKQERMYSEEDLISFAHFYFQEEFNSTMQTSKSTDEILQEWKQFKKK